MSLRRSGRSHVKDLSLTVHAEVPADERSSLVPGSESANRRTSLQEAMRGASTRAIVAAFMHSGGSCAYFCDDGAATPAAALLAFA